MSSGPELNKLDRIVGKCDAWNESDHPRAEDGKFGSGGGGGKSESSWDREEEENHANAAGHESMATDHGAMIDRHEEAAREADLEGDEPLKRQHQQAADLQERAERANMFAAKLLYSGTASSSGIERARRTATDLTDRANKLSHRLLRGRR